MNLRFSKGGSYSRIRTKYFDPSPDKLDWLQFLNAKARSSTAKLRRVFLARFTECKDEGLKSPLKGSL